MLALIFMIITCGGAFLLSSVGYYLHASLNVSAVLIPFALLSCVVVIYLVIFSYIFGIAWFARSHRPDHMRIEIKETFRLVLGEISFSMVLYLILTPLSALPWMKNPTRKAIENHEGLPVLMVHGFFCNAAFWMPMRRFLRKKGFGQTYSVTLDPPLFGDIEKFTQRLSKRVDEICEQTGSEKVVVVAHSMGGLVARNYIHNFGGDKHIEKLITLGTPHHGTTIADTVFFMGRHLRQMRRWSNEWLNKLNEHEHRPALVPTVSIFSYHDSIVSPQESPILKHARNIPLRGIGHLEMPFSKSVQDLVYQELIPLSD